MKPFLLAVALLGLPAGTIASAGELPRVQVVDGASQLLVDGKPFLILGGELGNSSAGTAGQADTILPELAGLHLNTVLEPVPWDAIEPQEGRFEFATLDHWIDVARAQHLHLVLLWFGSWKNAFSEYAPRWVLADDRRFPRVLSAEGTPLGILSPLGAETARCDSRAFAALMAHVREHDAAYHTVLLVQVENEVGFLGLGARDRSRKANELFLGAVPGALSAYLSAHREQLSPELAAAFRPSARTWSAMFGDRADEAFMAWQYASFVNQVARAGKAAYALPMYMNAELPAPFERAGDYPSGGPYPSAQAIYRAAAPAIDFYAPDIYWPDFAQWVASYRRLGNPVFVPEASVDAAPGNALYTLAEMRGFGFAPFGIEAAPQDQGHAGSGPGIGETYAALEPLETTVLEAQERGRSRALALEASSPRPSQTIALGGFLFRATLVHAWPPGPPPTSSGSMMVIEQHPDEFLILGSGLAVTFLRDPDADDRIAGIASVEEVSRTSEGWRTDRVLNGDQTDQGRALLMQPHQLRLYRVRLYTYAR